MEYLGSLGFTATLSYLVTWLLVPLADKFQLLDQPDARKRHHGAIPLVGGISIYITVTLVAAFTLSLPDTFQVVALICGVITLLGAIDDRYPAPAIYRLLIQLGAGISIAGIGAVTLHDLGDIWGSGHVQLGLIAIPFTAIAVCGLCNAYNMVDGIDGLAGGLALVAFGGLLSLVYGVAPAAEVALVAYLCVATCVFLGFNLQLGPLPTRKIFMGDAGSMFLGATIAVAMIYFSQPQNGEVAAMRPVTALWLVAVPLMDMAATMLRRMAKGASPLKPDRTHLHHILMRAGLSQRQALSLILGISLVLAGVGILMERVWPQLDYVSFALFVSAFIAYYIYVVKHAFKAAVFLRRLLD